MNSVRTPPNLGYFPVSESPGPFSVHLQLNQVPHLLQSLSSPIPLKTYCSWLLQHRGLWLNFPNKLEGHESHLMDLSVLQLPVMCPIMFPCIVAWASWPRLEGELDGVMDIPLKLPPLHMCLLQHNISLHSSGFVTVILWQVLLQSSCDRRFKKIDSESNLSIPIWKGWLSRMTWNNDLPLLTGLWFW